MPAGIHVQYVRRIVYRITVKTFLHNKRMRITVPFRHKKDDMHYSVWIVSHQQTDLKTSEHVWHVKCKHVKTEYKSIPNSAITHPTKKTGTSQDSCRPQLMTLPLAGEGTTK